MPATYWLVRAAGVLLVVCTIVLTACSRGSEVASDPDRKPTVKSVTGVVVDVQSRSLTTLDLFTIRAEDGTVFTFTSTERFVGFTPSHLNEHRAFAVPVTVTYEDIEGNLVILSIDD